VAEAAILSGREGDAVTNHVFVADGGRAVRRPVTLGVRSTGFVEVTTGLAAGEQVVIGGQDRLQDGALVRAVTAPTVASRDAAPGAARAGAP
jgi:membrane fusion protein (multidrug efflux system)